MSDFEALMRSLSGNADPNRIVRADLSHIDVIADMRVRQQVEHKLHLLFHHVLNPQSGTPSSTRSQRIWATVRLSPALRAAYLMERSAFSTSNARSTAGYTCFVILTAGLCAAMYPAAYSSIRVPVCTFRYPKSFKISP